MGDSDLQLSVYSPGEPLLKSDLVIPSYLVTCIISAVIAANAFNCESARAAEDRAIIAPNETVSQGGGIDWKLTPSVYHETAARAAVDLNLRGNRDSETFWIGQYQRGAEFEQTRAGYEHQFTIPFGRIIASGQIASRGFLGGSVTLEASAASSLPSTASFVGLIGLGRTNLKPYYNLNFDPNDSVLVGASWRPDAYTAVTVFQVFDNRLNTGQRVTHFVLRQKTGPRSRWTVDLFNRTGRNDAAPDTEMFRATGITLTYDFEPWFGRIAWDPKANYTNSDMTRFAIGVRF